MTKIYGNPLEPMYRSRNRDVNKFCDFRYNEGTYCDEYALFDRQKNRFRKYCAKHAKGPSYSKDILADPREI